MPNSITHTRWANHLRGVAGLANEIADRLDIRDDAARQACFATIVIDAGKHGVFVEPIPEAASPIERGNEVVSEAAPRPRRVEPPMGKVVGENVGALKDPTPEQAEGGERIALLKGINSARELLKFTADDLNTYILDKMKIKGGLGVLDIEQLRILTTKLSQRIDAEKKKPATPELEDWP